MASGNLVNKRGNPEEASGASRASGRALPGHWVVVGMFGFGILATSLIWLYWNLHVAPYMPVQLALEERFADSSPRVEGGQRKMHKLTPSILRVVMRVSFNPQTDVAARDEFLSGVAEVLNKQLSLESYDHFELHMYQPDPERKLVQGEIKLTMEQLLERL